LRNRYAAFVTDAFALDHAHGRRWAMVLFRSWTFNLGHPMGRFLLVMVLALVFAALVVVAFTSGRPT
jgi:hypothetical protein